MFELLINIQNDLEEVEKVGIGEVEIYKKSGKAGINKAFRHSLTA